MQPESQFVYDWLKVHVKHLKLRSVYLESWDMTRTPYSSGISTLESHTTKATFNIYAEGLVGSENITFTSPTLIDIKYFYRALLELDGDGVKTNLTQENVARILNITDPYEVLRQTT